MILNDENRVKFYALMKRIPLPKNFDSYSEIEKEKCLKDNAYQSFTSLTPEELKFCIDFVYSEEKQKKEEVKNLLNKIHIIFY